LTSGDQQQHSTRFIVGFALCRDVTSSALRTVRLRHYAARFVGSRRMDALDGAALMEMPLDATRSASTSSLEVAVVLFCIVRIPTNNFVARLVP
jgi:hypothetical protein